MRSLGGYENCWGDSIAVPLLLFSVWMHYCVSLSSEKSNREISVAFSFDPGDALRRMLQTYLSDNLRFCENGGWRTLFQVEM
jgi:hypothetical protein